MYKRLGIYHNAQCKPLVWEYKMQLLTKQYYFLWIHVWTTRRKINDVTKPIDHKRLVQIAITATGQWEILQKAVVLKKNLRDREEAEFYCAMRNFTIEN